jgi:hypothetical protein
LSTFRFHQSGILAFVLSLVMIACAPTAVMETNKAPYYTKQPKRLFVFETTNPQFAESSASFQFTMIKLLGSCGVTMGYASQSSHPNLALGDSSGAINQAKTQIAQFHPDAILTVTWTRITTRSNPNALVSADYLFELTDVASRKSVWKATVTGFSVGANLATRIVARMREEGILPSSCQPSTV